MRAPTMIENAKKRSPTISQRAWKLPMPSPMRSNHPSVRRASSGKLFVGTAMLLSGLLGSHGSRFLPMPAHGFHTTTLAAHGVTARGAALEHAQVTERKIVANRV